jgi:predicted Zn-dependent peptidase
VLGEAEIIERITREEVAGYLRRNYGPEHLVLAAAGQVEHERLVALARDLFRDLPAGAPPKLEPARFAAGDRRTERDLEQLHLVLGFPGVGYLDEDYYVQTVLSTIYGGGMSSRLFQEVRESRGLVYSIYSFATPYADGGLFAVYAGTGEREAGELLPLVAQELASLPATLEPAELERAKAQLRADILMARESSSARAEQLAQQLLAYGRPLDPAEIVARVDAVDAAAVQRLARRVASGPLAVAALGPVSSLPEPAALAALFH